MTVKRIGGGKDAQGKPAAKPVPAAKAVLDMAKRVRDKVFESDNLALPTEPKEVDQNLGHYIALLYGQPGIGKTTCCASWPNAIFFETEPGLKGKRVFSLNDENGGVIDWTVFRAGVDLICQGGHQFETVIIDTADRAYDMALDWVCRERGIEYPGEDANDFGKSWRAVKVEFLEQVNRLAQKVGVVFTSHAKESEIKGRSGEKFSRIIPSMSNQARQVIEALVDFAFYAEYFKDDSGDVVRVFVCQGDETIWAKTRETPGGEFPRFMPLMKRGFYESVNEAFMGKNRGLDISQLQVGKMTSKTAGTMVAVEKAKAAREKAAAGKGEK